MKLGHAKRLRKLIEQTAVNLTDEEALEGIELFPAWKTSTEYAVGDRVRHGEHLYKCVQAHTSQIDWTPDVAVSLWVEVADPAIEWPEWKQPTGSHDAYMKDDKVTYKGKHYICDSDYNTYAPDVWGWHEA